MESESPVIFIFLSNLELSKYNNAENDNEFLGSFELMLGSFGHLGQIGILKNQVLLYNNEVTYAFFLLILKIILLLSFYK